MKKKVFRRNREENLKKLRELAFEALENNSKKILESMEEPKPKRGRKAKGDK